MDEATFKVYNGLTGAAGASGTVVLNGVGLVVDQHSGGRLLADLK